MTYTYPAIFHNEEGSCWVEFPDLEGCNTCGDTFEEAIKMATEALGLYLNGLRENDQVIPMPSDINTIYPGKDAFVTYIHSFI